MDGHLSKFKFMFTREVALMLAKLLVEQQIVLCLCMHSRIQTLTANAWKVSHMLCCKGKDTVLIWLHNRCVFLGLAACS